MSTFCLQSAFVCFIFISEQRLCEFRLRNGANEVLILSGCDGAYLIGAQRFVVSPSSLDLPWKMRQPLCLEMSGTTQAHSKRYVTSHSECFHIPYQLTCFRNWDGVCSLGGTNEILKLTTQGYFSRVFFPISTLINTEFRLKSYFRLEPPFRMRMSWRII
jgi:hypothetical protein